MLMLVLALTLCFSSGQWLPPTTVTPGTAVVSEVSSGENLRDRYHEYNEKYFESKLPEGDSLKVEYSVLPGLHDDSGETFVTNYEGVEEIWIYLNAKLRDFWFLSDAVLLHEMVHIKLRNLTQKDPHGVLFQKE